LLSSPAGQGRRRPHEDDQETPASYRCSPRRRSEEGIKRRFTYCVSERGLGKVPVSGEGAGRRK
jgi:hypothetical protein